REFFQAGGASGTIAKSISAYDMVFSDAIYGKAPRYVSRERLKLMLDHEYQLLIERLSVTRGERTNFFVFADTVATSNYKGNNEAHGWLGLRFQTQPMGAPSEIDMLRFSGPAFESVDTRLMSLYLVKFGLTNAVMFGKDGEVLQPSEVP